jgi:hypothetical protein
MCKFPHELTDDKNTIVSTVGERERRTGKKKIEDLFVFFLVLYMCSTFTTFSRLNGHKVNPSLFH